jgi:hypothetical protein
MKNIIKDKKRKAFQRILNDDANSEIENKKYQ